ncbi:MAG: HIT domain-containing protein [Gammaproteobacteria bacterium]
MAAKLFQLHPQLSSDCFDLGRFELCRLLMMNDNQYPWFILVPEIAEIREIYQLSKDQRAQLQEESCFLAEQISQLFNADKMNIAAIGNLVPQLHIHHVVRYRNDKAWPAPIWGKYSPVPYSNEQRQQRMNQVKVRLGSNLTA